MLSEGAIAPSVVLPGYVDGERERVDLGASLGDERADWDIPGQ
ncbi:MAG: hypothetical protein V5A28_03225 [Haloarculaceae archaeon]